MNALMQPPPADLDSGAWRRELIAAQLSVMAAEQQRSRFFGQLLFVAALVLLGMLAGWMLRALDLVGPIDLATLDRVTVVVVFLSATLLLASLVTMWDVRLRLSLSEMKLLRRELERGDGEKPR